MRPRRTIAIVVVLAVALLAAMRLHSPSGELMQVPLRSSDVEAASRVAIRRAVAVAASGQADSLVQSAMNDAMRLIWGAGAAAFGMGQLDDHASPVPPAGAAVSEPAPSPEPAALDEGEEDGTATIIRPPPPPSSSRLASQTTLPPPPVAVMRAVTPPHNATPASAPPPVSPRPSASIASSAPRSGGSVTATTATMRRILGGSGPLLDLHQRSQQLRLYIYSPPATAGWCASNLTARFPKCAAFQWSGDWELLQRVQRSSLRTIDGDAADFYLVPFLSKCYFNFAAGYKLRPMDSALAQVLTFLKATPWWERRPERHLFFFMSGIGAGIVPSWQKHLSSAVFVVAEGDRQADYFREGHDIVVPGKVSLRHKRQQIGAAERKLVGVFRGSLDASLRDEDGGRVRHKNKLRHALFDHLEEEGRRFIFSGRKSKTYVNEMDHSKFCIIPRGNTPWTRRFFDAVVRGCVPAVLSDPVSFPFERLLDYTRMTIKLPEMWAERLAPELRAINDSAIQTLHTALQAYWPAFVYDKGVAFEMLLLELAARKHAFFANRAPATLNTEHDFWSPTHGHFRLPRSKKMGPSWGAGAVPH